MRHSVIVLTVHKSNSVESTPKFGIPALTGLLESIERQVELEDLAGFDAVKGDAGRQLEVDDLVVCELSMEVSGFDVYLVDNPAVASGKS
jgi:hypothetical protein